MPLPSIPKPLVVVAAVVAAVLLAFFAGRYSAPAKTVTVERRVEVEKATTVVQQKLDLAELHQALTQFAENVHKDVVRERVVVVNKDGSKTITEKTTDRSQTDVKQATATKAEAVTHAEKAETKTVEVIRTVERTVTVTNSRAPGWLLGVQAGGSPLHLSDGAGPSYVPGLPRATSLGLTLDRRLFGGLYGGVWVNSRGEAGVGLRLAF